MARIKTPWCHFVSSLVVFFALYCCQTEGLSCFVCNSTLDQNCNEKFESPETNPIKMEPCNVYRARYCVKVYGMWGGTVGTHRFCSSHDMGKQCQDIWYPDHDRMYRSCIFTCSSDGCNPAAILTVRRSHLLLASLFALLVSSGFIL